MASECTHIDRNGKKRRVMVWPHETIMGGDMMPSVFRGDVYSYDETGQAGIPTIHGHLTRSEFERSFNPLQGMEEHHATCVRHCEEINGV